MIAPTIRTSSNVGSPPGVAAAVCGIALSGHPPTVAVCDPHGIHAEGARNPTESRRGTVSGMDELVERLRRAGCVFAEDEAAVLREAATLGGDLETFVRSRIEGTPLEYVVGWADFAGIRVPIDPGVFVPRPRSAVLVDVVSQSLAPGDLLVDLCCGSGAIAAAVAARVPVRIAAADNDPAAVANATRTLAGLDALVSEGHLFDALPVELRGLAGAIAVVAPYVPTGAIALLPREARDYEPLSALDGGPDGLRILEHVVADAPEWLRPGGMFATEVGVDQVDAVMRLCMSAGLRPAVVEDDEVFVVAARLLKR